MSSDTQMDGGDTVIVSLGKTPATSKRIDEDTAIHVCWDCNARFTRLEHLKRHITSLHITSPKSHGCEYCGKSFSRRDVLLRHHQSCRAAKEGQADQANKTRRHSSTYRAEGDQLQKTKSNQDKCTVGHDCIYRQSSDRQLLSPTESRPDGDTVHLSPEPYSGTAPISPPSHETNLLLLQTATCETQLRPASNFEPTVPTSHNQRLESPSQIAQLDYFNPNSIMVSSNDNSRAQRSNSSEAQLQDGRRPANKRGRYVSNACITCQKRKVKCSGEETCVQCRSAGLSCVYNTGRKRRNTTAAETRPVQSNQASSPLGKAESPMKISESLKQMMDRIASLERECNAFKEHVAFTTFGDLDHNGSSTSSYEMYSDECSPSNSSVTSFPSTEVFHGATNLLEPIQILNRTVVHEQNEHQEPAQTGSSSAITWRDLPKSHNKDLKTLEKETRMTEIVGLCNSVDIFFSYLNPHYPCINENEFRSQFQRFLENDPSQAENADFYQFLALVNLIQAEVKILSEDMSDSTNVPAWEEFCRAESILTHLTWLGNGNMLTIQCLLIKARYLLYIEKADSAYDTMSRIVCLCFKLGLHDQPKWSDSVTPFETVMRQRIFWTIFYLERNIAFNCGAPYLIRESDFNVDLPKNLEDSRMFPGEPLPPENMERSNGAYLSGAVKWGRLCSEIWDTVFGVNAIKPTSQEFIASIDARIIYTMGQFPEHLQWDRNIHRLTGTTDVPHYILRQTIILYLRMNQLSLLLRQEMVLNMQYDPQTATQCVAIATSSIDAVHLYLSSSVHRPTDRFSSVLYLVGALLPLVCIIVKDDNSSQTRGHAIASFKKGLSLLNAMSPNFSWARHTLRRIHRIIGTAKRAIEVFDSAGMFNLDMSEFFEGDMMQQSRYTDFFNLDTWTAMEKDVGNLTEGSMTGSTSMSFRFGTHGTTGLPEVNMNVTHPDFPSTADEMDSFWVEDFLKDRGGVFPTG